MRSTPGALRAVTPLIVALSLTLSGCGGDSAASTAPASGGDDSDAARIQLAQCLRDNGVDVPDGGGGARSDVDREKRREAIQGPCKEFQTGAFGNVSEEDRQEMQDAFQKFAQCMRDEGIDLPDAGPGSGGGPPTGRGRIDRDDPKTQEAMKACQDELPQGRGPGGRGGQ